MKPRKLAALAAVSVLWSTAPATAQTGPNPAPEAAPAAEPTPQPDRMGSSGGGIFGSDLTFMLVAIIAAGLLTFLATQVGGEDEPISP